MTAPIRRILVLGGYGAFGRRLVELLGSDAGLHVLVAGRSLSRASQFCESLEADAQLEPVVVDREGDIGLAFDQLEPDLVIDCSGPFQAYGRDPYRVVVAAVTRGIHYADLADSADFVRGISQFNGAALRSGVFVLSGLSTCPALTGAAVRHLTSDLTQVETIEAGITPSPAVDVGKSVVRAIASYAGKPVARPVDGVRRFTAALTDHRKATIHVPGVAPLLARRFSLVEVPDLMLLEDCFPGVRSIWVGAAVSPGFLHRILNAMSWLVRWRILDSLVPFTRLMHRVSSLCRWGEHRGGMYVTASGNRGPATRITRTWHLVAEGSRGPYIPTIAAAAIVRQCNSGKAPATGARPATGELQMKDFDDFFKALGIVHGVSYDAAGSKRGLYRRILGNAWLDLPPSVLRIHDDTETRKWRGRAKVSRGDNVLARFIGSLFRFPPASDDVAVTVEFRRHKGRETWIRNFSGKRFSSVQWQGRGRYDGLLCERFGPFTFGIALVVDNGRLRVPIRRWSMLGIPLPLWLAPRSNTCEFDDGGTFRFHIDVRLPLIGQVVGYSGYIDEEVPLPSATYVPDYGFKARYRNGRLTSIR